MSRLLCSTLYRNLIGWEDFKVGDQAELGRHAFTGQEIAAFRRQFDPQPFHTDRAAAQAGFFGGLIAMGSPGVENIRRLKEGWGLFGRKN